MQNSEAPDFLGLHKNTSFLDYNYIYINTGFFLFEIWLSRTYGQAGSKSIEIVVVLIHQNELHFNRLP